MPMKKTLYLASKSPSRQYLLRESKIDFTLLSQNADEAQCDWSLSINEVVTSIARYKMNCVTMPQGTEGEQAFVLTADTLTQDKKGVIHGKPLDKSDALRKMEALRDGVVVATAFCLSKKVFRQGAWILEDQREQCVISRCEFIVPSSWAERYFKESVIGYEAAGGMAVEAYGMQFLRYIEGSYSAVIGLPLFEVREALDALTFFNE